MKLDELVEGSTNHWLVEPGRVKFAAVNGGVFPVLLQGPLDEQHAELLVYKALVVSLLP